MSGKTAVSFSVGLAGALVAALWWSWPSHSPAPKAPVAARASTGNAEPKPQAPTPVAAVASPAAKPAVLQASAAPKVGGLVRYPDGSSKPALNKVAEEVKLNWGVGAFTPVVSVEDGPGGWQWYVHQNGARSTTAMVTMNGVPQAMGFVAEPHQTLPVFDSSFGKQLEAMQSEARQSQQGGGPTARR